MDRFHINLLRVNVKLRQRPGEPGGIVNSRAHDAAGFSWSLTQFNIHANVFVCVRHEQQMLLNLR